MFQRRGENGGEIFASGAGRRFEAGHVVVVTEDLVGLVLRSRSRRPHGTPRRRAVIGAFGQYDRRPAGVGAGDHQRHQGGVGAVLTEHGPVGVADHAGQGFSQFHHQAGRTGQGVAPGQLIRVRRVDDRVAIAEQVWTVGAHEVEQLVAVGVPQPRAPTRAEELRVVIRQKAHRLVSVHAAGNHRFGAGPKLAIVAIRLGHGITA